MGNQSASRNIDSLKELIQQREQFLKQSTGIGNLKGSYIIDQIGASIPLGITFTEIAVHPILFKEEDANKEPVYQPGIIRIHALVRESNALNLWIKRLEGMVWVESVAFSDYREKEEHEAGVTLEITMNDYAYDHEYPHPISQTGPYGCRSGTGLSRGMAIRY